MCKYKVILILLVSALMGTAAYSQENLHSNQIKTVSGTVTKTDFVGNTITVLTNDQKQMAFFVPGNVIITQEAHDIGLMDIREGNPVTIQYDNSSTGQSIAVSIVDNKL